MTDKADRLKQARVRAGYETASDAAVAMGVNASTYIQHENGTRGFPNSKAERYARFFKVKPEFITHGVRTNVADSFMQLGPRLYVKGEVAAGIWREAWQFDMTHWEAFTGLANIDAEDHDRFGLRVAGESMNLLYPPGSIVECVRYTGQQLSNGQRVIVQRVRADGCVETTVKEYLRDDDGVVWLVPRSSSPNFQLPFRCDRTDESVTHIEIIGIVVASIRPE